MLDESGARIILLVAPAGYGKTTLAREWLEDPSRRAAWYRGGPASRDVAALSVELAAAAAEIVPGAGEPMRERLSATPRPEDDAQILAEMLVDDLERWPDGAWLAVDDYHFAKESAAAEIFISTLTEAPRLRLLIASRHRPGWASARRRLYGELLEVDRTDLAMNDDEANSVLQVSLASGSDFLKRAAGWPAVIGLAANAQHILAAAGELPDALYEYFAEELFQGLSSETRAVLLKLAIAPSGQVDLLESLLEPAEMNLLLRTGQDLGVVSPGRENVNVHPLFRNFLERKLSEEAGAILGLVNRVARHLLVRGDWDELFDLARRFNRDDLFLSLVERGVRPMLETGRLATVARWIDYAADRGHLSSSALDLAEAEIALREGTHDRAEVLATHALRQGDADNNARVKAFLIAGRAAHLSGRDEASVGYYRHAYGLSAQNDDKQAALWGQCLALLDLEQPGSESILDELHALSSESAEDLVRLATASFHLHIRQGFPVSPRSAAAEHLLSRVRDPMVRSAFLNAYGGYLTLRGRYESALEVAQSQIEEAKRFRLTFTLPHAYMREAAAQTGLRNFSAAHNAIDQTEALADISHDRHIQGMSAISRASVLISAGSAGQVDVWRDQTDPRTLASLDGELLATWAVARATVGDYVQAIRLARLARSRTSTIEARALAAFARRITQAQRVVPGANNRLRSTALAVLAQGNVNGFVLAYRAYPQVLGVLRGDTKGIALGSILTRANDTSLAQSLHLFDRARSPRNSNLTPRETEVLGLLAEGKTNREIARTLFLSESTVKVHVRHIFEKTGARSRTEAALRHAQQLN